MMIRLLLAIVTVWLIFRLAKRLKQHQQQSTPKANNESIVKCGLCKTYIPQSQAIKDKDHWFCNKDHQDEFYQ